MLIASKQYDFCVNKACNLYRDNPTNNGGNKWSLQGII